MVSVAAGKPKNVKCVSLLQGLSSPHDYYIHNSNLTNLLKGIYERAFFVSNHGKFVDPPKPVEGIFQRLRQYIPHIHSDIPRTLPIPLHEVPGLYEHRRRKVYESKVESLAASPINERDGTVSTFSKVEKVKNKAKKEAVPRIIQPVSGRLNAVASRFAHVVEMRIFESIGRLWGGRTIVKGMNGAQVGELALEMWNEFDQACCVGLDASRFDQHVSSELIEVCRDIATGCFALERDRKECAKTFDYIRTIHGKCYVDGFKVEYRNNRGLASGVRWTSFVGCVSASLMVKSFIDHVGVKARLLNNGDDCLLFLDRRDLPKLDGFYEWMLEYGFNFVLESPVYELEHAVFCQSKFINVGERVTMVRDPATAISKDSISISPFNSDGHMKAWLHSVGTGGLALNSGVPVMQSFYNCYIRNGRYSAKIERDPTLETGTRFLTIGMEAVTREVSETARYSFFIATGLTPCVQMELEHYYDTLDIVYGREGISTLHPDLWRV